MTEKTGGVAVTQPRKARSPEEAELRKQTVGQLRAAFAARLGRPTKSNNKDFLVRQLLGGPSFAEEALREQATDAQRAEAERAAAHVPPPEPARDGRLPPAGTVLRRAYKGREHQVTVLEQGFEYRGRTYTSLSTLAGEITGTSWNGFLFFGLQKRGPAGRPS